MEKIFYAGLDVHKDSTEVSIFCGAENEPIYEKRFEKGMSEVIVVLKKFNAEGKVKACYEAGCTGFTLQRELEKEKIECVVAAPGKLPRRATDRVKTDRRDARKLARLLRMNDITAIRIPTVEQEAVRDYLRLRDDIRRELQRAKKQLLSFLLRNGFRYSGAHWTKRHRQWMQELKYGHQLHQEIFEEYYTRITELEERLGEIDRAIETIAEGEKYRDAVAILRCFRGIEYLTALSCVVEVGDFSRFPTAASFMAYLGLVPSEHSSGDKRRPGGITKAGNAHLRRLLVEASWHYRYPTDISKRLRARRAGQPAALIAYANKAIRRLRKKYFTLALKRNKKSTVAVTAVARELAGFIWGAMNNKIAA